MNDKLEGLRIILDVVGMDGVQKAVTITLDLRALEVYSHLEQPEVKYEFVKVRAVGAK